MCGKEIIQGVPDLDVHLFPVVQASAEQAAIIDLEAKRLDQMQMGAGSQAGSSDIAGVGRDFWRDQDDMKGLGLAKKGGHWEVGCSDGHRAPLQQKKRLNSKELKRFLKVNRS